MRVQTASPRLGAAKAKLASPRLVATKAPTAPAAEQGDLFSKAGWKSATRAAEQKGRDAILAKAEARKAAKAAKAAELTARRTLKRKAEGDGPAAKQRRQDGGGGSATGDGPKETNAFRAAHAIIVDASCPQPFETFDAAAPELGKALVKALKGQAYTEPTPIQAQAWPIALEGRDMVAVAKTGSGKTCGFLLPALARFARREAAPKQWSEAASPRVLVLAPTRELVQQIAAEADKFVAVLSGVRTVAIFGGVPKGDQVRELRQGADVLMATPGRLIDFCTGKEERSLGALVSLKAVGYLVLDELDMGFEADIRKIVGWCPKTGKPEEGWGAESSTAGTQRQTLFFTATWPKAVERTAASLTSANAAQVRIGQGAGDELTANANVTQVVSVLQWSEKLGRLKEVLKAELHSGETAIIFAATKGACDYLEREIRKLKLDAWCNAIHSGREQWERDETLTKFRTLTAGTGSEKGILVATDVAARGLDIPGVALVVVYDFAQGDGRSGVESYVHRIGRTGRAGRRGRAFTFFSPEDAGARKLVELLDGAGQVVPKELEALADRDRGGGKGKGKGKGGGKGKGKGKSKGGGQAWR